MLLIEKYQPKNTNEFLFNRELMNKLVFVASFSDIPHIILTGLPGSGKRTLVKFLLQALYDPSVHRIKCAKYILDGTPKREVEVMQSNYHILIEPNKTTSKCVVQDIIKKYASQGSLNIYKTKRPFKTIVIYNIENLSNNSQAALRRTMEKYASTCRFIMVCNNLTKILDPLRSRCSIFCVPMPTCDNVLQISLQTCVLEGIPFTQNVCDYIKKNCGTDINKALWYLENCRTGYDAAISCQDSYLYIVKKIVNVKKCRNVTSMFTNTIREHIYKILITIINGSCIIAQLLELLLPHLQDDDKCYRLIQYASRADNNMIYGRRDILHIDYFVAGALQIFEE